MPTFSIIVPVYNAEKTLYKCLDSLCAQTYEDFEVHLVENGSGDSSRSICREFAQKDPRFQLHVSEQNCGPSGARNIGLDHARGTYIAFLDSDDYVEEAYLRELHQAFENADVVFFGKQFIGIGNKSGAVELSNVKLMTMPGKATMYGGASYYVMNKEYMFRRNRNEEKYYYFK